MGCMAGAGGAGGGAIAYARTADILRAPAAWARSSDASLASMTATGRAEGGGTTSAATSVLVSLPTVPQADRASARSGAEARAWRCMRASPGWVADANGPLAGMGLTGPAIALDQCHARHRRRTMRTGKRREAWWMGRRKKRSEPGRLHDATTRTKTGSE